MHLLRQRNTQQNGESLLAKFYFATLLKVWHVFVSIYVYYNTYRPSSGAFQNISNLVENSVSSIVLIV